MKKLMLSFLLVAIALLKMNGQIDEKQLTLSDEQLKAPTSARMVPAPNKLDCKCDGNIVQDGGFQKLTNSTTPPLSNIGAASNPWKINTLTPQWTSAAGACDNGFIVMWGNQAVYESVKQAITVPAACSYRVKFTARFRASTTIPTSVSLKVTIGSATVTSAAITNTAFSTYTMTLPSVPAGAQTIVLQPTNQHNVNNGNYVSWIDVDNICIEPIYECSPNFLIQLNEQPNNLYQVVATPATGAGFPHYWILHEVAGCPTGAVTASSLNWNAYVSATGAFSSSNPAITAGPSGYGYQYGGLGKGKCYRLIHYTRCCGKWFMQTKCFCLMSTFKAKMSDAEINANTETKEVNYNDLPAQLKQLEKQ